MQRGRNLDALRGGEIRMLEYILPAEVLQRFIEIRGNFSWFRRSFHAALYIGHTGSSSLQKTSAQARLGTISATEQGRCNINVCPTC